MYSSNCITFACTDLTYEGTASEQLKNIPVVWKIENFTRIKFCKMIDGKIICGPNFKFHPLNKDWWKLEISRKRDNYGNRYYGALVGIRKVFECKSTAFAFTISCSGQTDHGRESVKKHVKVPANVSYYVIFFNEITEFFLNIYERNNTCNMIIEIENDDDVARQTASSVTWDIKAPNCQSSLDKGKLSVLANMESILKKAEFSDVILRSQGKEIRAHGAILAGRSAVFDRMFEHQMSEKASGSVDIADIAFDTLQLLVSYMYSGRFADLDVKSASELFVASDKYAVEDLHETCSLFLKRSLTVENCLEILMLAELHSNEDLKSSAVAYFSQHSKEICQKPDWRNIIKIQPNVMYELLEVLSMK